MKKIVSTQGLLYGTYNDTMVSEALSERVNYKIEYEYNMLNSEDDHIHIENTSFSYDLINGEVTSIILSYTINDATPKRLEYFRDTCNTFFSVHGFMIDNDNSSAPRVFFKANDLFDMATLIHALEYQEVSLESIMCAVDFDRIGDGGIYTPSGDYILKVPDVPYYRIKEGTLYISPMAIAHCHRLKQLDIPHCVVNLQKALKDYSPSINIRVWDTHYDGTPIEDEDGDVDDDEPTMIDEHQVVYSADGKRLICCRYNFSDISYEVPDGVEEIEDLAFVCSRQYMKLSLPRSIKVIGGNLFGNGGYLEFR